jgi:uncharacterized protein YecT (DUF1311 family)
MPSGSFVTAIICSCITFAFSASSSISQELAFRTVNKDTTSNLAKSDSNSAAATGEVIDPIDKQEQDCLANPTSTAAMLDCAEVAYAAWDKELNRVYSQLRQELPPTSKQLLKDSQLEWLKYRNKELKTIDDIYSHVQGSMYLPIRVTNRTEIVKGRVLQLRSYLELPFDSDR